MSLQKEEMKEKDAPLRTSRDKQVEQPCEESTAKDAEEDTKEKSTGYN